MRDLLRLLERASRQVGSETEQEIIKAVDSYTIPTGEVKNATILTDLNSGFSTIIPLSPLCYFMVDVDFDSAQVIGCRIFNISKAEMRQYIEHELPYCNLYVHADFNYLEVCNRAARVSEVLIR